MKEIANNLEDDEVSMDVDSCSRHGRKQLLKIPSIGCLDIIVSNKASNVIIVCKIFRSTYFKYGLCNFITCYEFLLLHI